VFNESKSPLKALEYAAMGIPVIASDFGPYPEFVVHGVTGFLAKREKDWRDHIRELAADADLRESMGKKARELAAQHTIEGNWHRWAAAYQEVLS
jgi:glycosyltransferase involved in cell wall biosynthesis